MSNDLPLSPEMEQAVQNMIKRNETPKMEYGPYIMNVNWAPMTSEEEKAKAMETLCQIARDLDRSADFELTCVQSLNFRRE